MTESSIRFFLITSILLCIVLAAVLAVLGLMAPALRLIFVPYQFFLVGICVGALVAATIGLVVERHQWTHYRTYFLIVMTNVFLLVVVNSIIFRVLGGQQFIRKLMRIFWVVFNLR